MLQNGEMRGPKLMLWIVVLVLACGLPILAKPGIRHVVLPIFGGVVLIGSGVAMLASEKFSRWAVKRGGEPIWGMLFGEDRATQFTRFLFGPMAIAGGVTILFIAYAPHR
jgi:uncharacterized membrane protein HdeD (DUF308 family)